jgi:hypothetical protein
MLAAAGATAAPRCSQSARRHGAPARRPDTSRTDVRQSLGGVPVKGTYGFSVGTPDGPVGMPVQCSAWDDEDGLGCRDAFGCGLGEYTGPGPQDGPVAGWPGDRVGPGLWCGVGVGWPGTRAGLVEWCGPGAGWLPCWTAGSVACGLLAVTDRSGPERGGAGAATVTCASC